MNLALRVFRLAALPAVVVACVPHGAAAQGPGDAKSPFVRVAEYTVNTDAVTHVTEYNNRITLWFPGRESTVFFEVEADRLAVRRWLDGHPAEFAKVGPNYMRLSKITHTRAVGPSDLEVNFEGGNRFTLRNPRDIKALNDLLIPKRSP